MFDSKNLVDPMNNFVIEFVKATPFHNKGKLSMIGATQLACKCPDPQRTLTESEVSVELNSFWSFAQNSRNW